MSYMAEIDDVAQGIADVTKELMYDSIHWQIAEYNAEGDNYNELHSHVMHLAITKMYEDINKEKTFSEKIQAQTSQTSTD